MISLDVFRGMTIAGMIIVNDPGSWSHIYDPLGHASWHGVTPTDFVFPFFLFIVGVSIVLAYQRKLDENAPQGDLIKKILKRSALIFGWGVLLWLWPNFDWAGIRIPGVLQRIALVFLVCSILFLKTDWKTQAWIGAGLLVGYWLMMALIPVPIDEVIRQAIATGEVKTSHGMEAIGSISQLSDSFIAANLEKGTNLQAWMDRLIIPGRLYQYTWDPEGVLSTLPSIGTGITGMMAGTLLVSKLERDKKMIWLMVGGFLAMVMGNVWDWFFPFNKNLWTSSYVMYTSGLATMTLGAMYWFVDVIQWDKWTYPFKVFGANAITAYILHSALVFLFFIKFGAEGSQWSLVSAFMSGLQAIGFSAKLASLAWALTYTAIIYLPVWILYRRKIFIKI
ncbi:MAG: DUF5009 domain-containing protein [Bacteroidia bacterium]